MFVCRDHSTGKMFYFQLKKEDGGKKEGGGKKNTSFSPRTGNNSPILEGGGEGSSMKFSPEGGGGGGQETEGMKNNNNNTEMRLVFEVYGVVPPSDEITVHLHKLLERRLIEMTIMEISGPLRRNPLLKV